MIGNLNKVQERLKLYVTIPDKQFSVRSGLNPAEDALKQKVRQYWADPRVATAKKLEGLTADLAGFNPRNTSNKQLREIASLLADRGIIDNDLAGTLASIDVQLDTRGREINPGRRVDAYAFFSQELDALKDRVAEGNETAKAAFIELKTSIAVVMALEEQAKGPRQRSFINVRT